MLSFGKCIIANPIGAHSCLTETQLEMVVYVPAKLKQTVDGTKN